MDEIATKLKAIAQKEDIASSVEEITRLSAQAVGILIDKEREDLWLKGFGLKEEKQ